MFDRTLAVLLLLCFSPFLLLIAVFVKINIGSPILFKQKRAGIHGKPFYIYKFRTMTNKVDANGELLPDRDRLTRFGKFLRNFSLDELPQLINIIRGEMSFVGPRPLFVEYVDRYTLEQSKRLAVKPGITGWAQVNGRNSISWEEKFALDVWYVENRTIWLDVKIILLTLKKVLKSEGIRHKDHETMPIFMGSKKSGEM